jgi:hypothetical protein
MNTNIKRTIFNPEDKLSEKQQKYYLELMPYEKANIARNNKFKFDVETKKWYTNDKDHPLLNDYKKKVIDFSQYKKENFLFFDPEKKEWYTFSSNEVFSNF